MFARPRLTTLSRAAAGVALLVVLLTACRHPKPQPANPPPPARPAKVTYSETHDQEIKEILDLGRQGRWEEARAKVSALQQQDPKNPLVARVQSWVTQQEQQRR